MGEGLLEAFALLEAFQDPVLIHHPRGHTVPKLDILLEKGQIKVEIGNIYKSDACCLGSHFLEGHLHQAMLDFRLLVHLALQRSLSQLLESLPHANIKRIFPSALTRLVATLGCFPCTACDGIILCKYGEKSVGGGFVA